MTTNNCTVSPAVSKSTNYPTHLINTADYAVAEDTDEYSPDPEKSKDVPADMQHMELAALHMAALGQIGRLFRLANLMLRTEATDWTTEGLATYALEIRKTGNRLESILSEIEGPKVIDPPPEEYADY